MRGNVLVDLRNIYRPEHARQAGLTYVSIGRPGKAKDGETAEALTDAPLPADS
jgi:UDPglucose 6-dehydrogenase